MKEDENGNITLSAEEASKYFFISDKCDSYRIDFTRERDRNALLRKENIRIYDEKAMLCRQIESKDRLITALQDLVTELENSCDYYAGLVEEILSPNKNESAANGPVICLDPFIGDGKEPA